MKIIAHRGFWRKKTEQNTLPSFKRAFEHGFGLETDVRDAHGQLVIAHDPVTTRAMPAEKLFKIFKQASAQQILAINIKANGLQDRLAHHLKSHHIKHYFIFDPAIPDALDYIKKKIKFFTRQSDLELTPHLLPQAQGIWLDSFHSNWFGRNLIEKHLRAGKKVCIVSPELHHRAYNQVWQMLRTIDAKHDGRLSLCTDLPEKAQNFFNVR